MSEVICLRLTARFDFLTGGYKSPVNSKPTQGEEVLPNLTDLTDNLLGGVSRVWLHPDSRTSRVRPPAARESVKSVKCRISPAPSYGFWFTKCGQTGVKRGMDRGQIAFDWLADGHLLPAMSFNCSKTGLKKTKYQPHYSLTQNQKRSDARLTEQSKKAENGASSPLTLFFGDRCKLIGSVSKSGGFRRFVASKGVGLHYTIDKMQHGSKRHTAQTTTDRARREVGA